MILQQDGASIAALKHDARASTYRHRRQRPARPSVNCLIMNTTGTMNQYFAWAGEFTAARAFPGTLPYLLKGQAPPVAGPVGRLRGHAGCRRPVDADVEHEAQAGAERRQHPQACAMAINRNTYFKDIDGGVGAVSDGIYRKNSPYYKNPGYPAYNPTKAKALVDAYKSANNVVEVELRDRHRRGQLTGPEAVRVLPAAVGRRRHHGDASSARSRAR